MIASSDGQLISTVEFMIDLGIGEKAKPTAEISPDTEAAAQALRIPKVEAHPVDSKIARR